MNELAVQSIMNVIQRHHNETCLCAIN